MIARFAEVERFGAARVGVAGKFLGAQAKLVVVAEEREIETGALDVFAGKRTVRGLAFRYGRDVGGVNEGDIRAAGFDA